MSFQKSGVFEILTLKKDPTVVELCLMYPIGGEPQGEPETLAEVAEKKFVAKAT